MHADPSTLQGGALGQASQTATGVPPVPPEDSPSAGDRQGRTGKGADIRQLVTDRIVAMLEKGGNVFRERWTRAASRGLPRNGKTSQPYRGANVLLLWDAAIEHGYASPVWLTYRQAADLGAQVRRGEHAVLCAHFEKKAGGTAGERATGSAAKRAGASREPRAAQADGETDEGDRAQGRAGRGVLVCRPFWLFNVAQIDGLPRELLDEVSEERPWSAYPPVEAATRLLVGSGATIRHGFERAMYRPDADEIVLPWPRRFTGPEAYCATALHELVHWTGHSARLHRDFGRRFGDAAYAFEELVAELGSAFVLGHVGLADATIEGHAGYLEAWLRVLKNDRSAIFTAARHAGEAFEFILAKGLQPLDGQGPSHDAVRSAGSLDAG